MLLQKKDETCQLYINYKDLNKITFQNLYPIPQIDNLLN